MNKDTTTVERAAHCDCCDATPVYPDHDADGRLCGHLCSRCLTIVRIARDKGGAEWLRKVAAWRDRLH